MRTRRVMKKSKGIFGCLVMAALAMCALPHVYAQTSLELSVERVSDLALERNLDIQIARYDAYVKRNDLFTAVSIFDTILNAGIGYTDDRLQRSSTLLGTASQTTVYEAALSKKLPTGTTLGAGVEHTRSWSDSPFASTNPAHDARVSLSVKQAVGKNFFGLLDRSEVKLTRLDIENAEYISLEKIEEALARVQKAYWRLVAARQKTAIRRDMLAQADELLEIYSQKIKIGLAEKVDLYAAQANQEVRKRELLVAEQEERSAANNLLLLLNYDIRDDIRVVTGESPALASLEYEDFIASLSEAVDSRRDYARARNDVDARQLEVVMKKNSLWPEVDLEASLLRNGVAQKYTQSVENVADSENPRYYFGLTVSVPLENSKAKGEVKSAQLEQAKTLLLLKKKERQIVVEVHDAVDAVNTTLEEARGNELIVKLQEEKLSEEQRRFRLGRSNSDTLIRFQEDLLRAQLDLADSLYAYHARHIESRLARQTLLARYWQEAL